MPKKKDYYSGNEREVGLAVTKYAKHGQLRARVDGDAFACLWPIVHNKNNGRKRAKEAQPERQREII